MWSFVCSKAEPAWVWVALDRETRPVVACCLGDRSEESCRYLWEQVPAPWREAAGYTDFWEAYQAVIPEAQHVAAGKGDTDEADTVRDEMDLPWRALSRKEIARLDGLSADLYMLEDDEVFEKVRPQIVAALSDAARNGTGDLHTYSQVVRRTVGRWVNTKHRRRPMIIPVVVSA